jgi:hypothetical protein
MGTRRKYVQTKHSQVVVGTLDLILTAISVEKMEMAFIISIPQNLKSSYNNR